MLKLASRAIVISTVETTKRLLGFVGGVPRPPSSQGGLRSASSYDTTDFSSHLSSHEIQALFEAGSFEDRLLSALLFKSKPIQFTPLQMMLLFIVCDGLLKNFFSRRKGAAPEEQSDELTTEETAIKSLLDLVASEVERIYHLTSARNALVSSDTR